jgi:ABC-type uncharacterized transport system substrate-binding protein
MKRTLSTALAALFILAIAALAVSHNMGKPRVLILHSYGTDYAWTRDIDVGLRRGLGDLHRFSLRWHYMDLKRHPWPDSRQLAGVQARRIIDEWKPELIIAVDDDAQQYAAKYYVNHPGIRIVFAGVNGSIEPYGYDKANNVTGVLERPPVPAMKDALLLAAGSRKPLRIMEISDDSENVKRDHEFMHQADWAPVVHTGTELVDTFPAWQSAVLAAGGKADVIMTINYRQLRRSKEDARLVPPEEVVRWTVEHATIPMVGINGFFVEDGGMLAIAKSPFEQGEAAAAMARKMLDDGVAAADIPIETSRQFVVLMRPQLMARHRMHLPEIYEAFARATNGYYIDAAHGTEAQH